MPSLLALLREELYALANRMPHELVPDEALGILKDSIEDFLAENPKYTVVQMHIELEQLFTRAGEEHWE